MLLVSEPCLGDDEKAALADVVDSNWITQGERVRAFERAFAELHGVEDAVAVSSCTAGLHLVLQALGIGTGDEVLVPSLTFVATANAVLYVGATPVFVDIESARVPLASPADAAQRCSARTKAVILVHYAGYLAERAIWQAFARARGLLLIEDAAHAIGAAGVGTWSDAAAFSFFGNKNITTGEGGMIVARDPAVIAAVRQLRGHGMTTGTQDRLKGRQTLYDVPVLGNNYRMDELRAAMGLVQLRRLPAWNARRALLTRRYREALAERGVPVSIPFASDWTSAHHIFPVLLPRGCDRQDVADRMRDSGIQTSVHYPPVHAFSLYRKRFLGVTLPCTEDFARRELTLPLFPKMLDTDVDLVVGALSRALSGTLSGVAARVRASVDAQA
jgi:dTDP-4-amino-4,6-dideoxygalactose transaminase